MAFNQDLTLAHRVKFQDCQKENETLASYYQYSIWKKPYQNFSQKKISKIFLKKKKS